MMDNRPSPELKISPKLQEAAAADAAIAIKPRNYFNELSPERLEEHRRLDAMIAETERYKKVGEAVDMFESFQRWLKITDNSKSAKSKLKPKAERNQ
jgi:hypothetical protein